MEMTPQWFLVLEVFVWFIIVLRNSAEIIADGDDSGVISIDCGAREDYSDKKIKYEADDAMFIGYGETHNVSWDYSKEQIGKQLSTLRSFPIGKRNCYTLKPRQGKNTYYLVRAYFAYGNYSNTSKVPSFDLHIGVNYWATINQSSGAKYIERNEVIHISPSDDIDVCLAKTGEGEPFISLLEVWPLQNSRYDQIASSLLRLISRSNLGMSEEDATYIRYTDDIYGRSWLNRRIDNSVRINASTSTAIDINTAENTYKLPKEVLSTAVQALDVSSSLIINVANNANYDYFVYLHFYEFEKLSQNQQRKLDVAFSDGINVSLSLEYLRPTTVVRNIKQANYVGKVSISSTPDSHVPAMLNAYEIFRVLPVNSATDEGDINAIQNIKQFYNINRISWQGDPCMPVEYTWEGLTCNYNSTPRIISLKLKSSKLTNGIAPSITNLTKLESLDLSNNQLTEKIPDFLTGLSNLKYLDLTRNNFKGRVPKALNYRSKAHLLDLRVDKRNMDDKDKGRITRIAVGVTVGVGGSVAVSVSIAIPVTRLLRKKKANQRGANNNKEEANKPSNDGGPSGSGTAKEEDKKTEMEITNIEI